MDTEYTKHKGNRGLNLTAATGTVLDNLPILVCGLVMTLALVHEWIR
jgi:hypothetical protein